MKSQTRFPRHIDMPARVLLWSMDQIVPFFSIFALGIITGQIFKAILLGACLTYLVNKFRSSRPDGYLAHMGYWFGIVGFRARSTINAFCRRIEPQ